jgi:hypothetical protein
MKDGMIKCSSSAIFGSTRGIVGVVTAAGAVTERGVRDIADLIWMFCPIVRCHGPLVCDSRVLFQPSSHRDHL